MTPEQLFTQYSWILVVLALWSLPWKGWALWKAARLHDIAWFIALLILNTLGILEIFYVFIFSRRKSPEKITKK